MYSPLETTKNRLLQVVACFSCDLKLRLTEGGVVHFGALRQVVPPDKYQELIERVLRNGMRVSAAD